MSDPGGLSWDMDAVDPRHRRKGSLYAYLCRKVLHRFQEYHRVFDFDVIEDHRNVVRRAVLRVLAPELLVLELPVRNEIQTDTEIESKGT